MQHIAIATRVRKSTIASKQLARVRLAMCQIVRDCDYDCSEAESRKDNSWPGSYTV